jgi:probable HAF family extracellular repeat protein
MIGRIEIGIIWVFCLVSTGLAQTRYQITRIPTVEGTNSVALGINNQGDVVGYSFQGEDYQGFLYSTAQRSLTNVGSLGGNITAACAINDAGQVTGYSQDANGNYLAFLFSRNQPITSLGTLDNASTSEAFGINKSGAVVGDSQSGELNHRPVLFSKNSVQDLGLGGSNDPDALETAYAINDAGQIVGRHSYGKNIFHAFTLLDGNTTDLRTLGGTNGEALAINKSGTVVGDSDTTEGSTHGFVFERSQLKDLGTLPGFETSSFARGINNSGDIVGESDSADQKRAFLFTKNQLVELDRLTENLAEAGFKSLDVAYGINDKGSIVGYGTTSNDLKAAYIAVPDTRHEEPAGGVAQPVAQQTTRPPPTPQPQDNGQEQPSAGPDSEDYDVFYSGLSSDEGNWVEAGNYGYCFRPRVSENWRPYREGHWVWTDQGWYWDSSERFAWATYHYGRWVNIDGTGWCWVPGNQWAPAWVSWRESAEHVGWAPLPPEAEVSSDQPISSWSDSNYDIGPAAYAFISFAHWREPNYARYVERPERNIQIIRETRNVTNIVTQNNVINNFGPRVQTIERRTNHPIPQVQLALNRSTEPKANYGQTRQGNRLNVIAPAANLRAQGARAPSVQNRIENPRVEKGWRGVRPADAAKLKKTIAEQNPPPKSPPQAKTLVNPRPDDKGRVSETPGTTGSPAVLPSPVVAAPGQRPPPNLLKPGGGPPNVHGTPGSPPNAAVPGRSPGHGKKPIPPNLLETKPSTTPHSAATPQSVASPAQAGKPETKPSAPANLVKPNPTGTPRPPTNQEAPRATPTLPAAPANPIAPTITTPTPPPPPPSPKLNQGRPTVQAPATPPAAPSPKLNPAPSTIQAPATPPAAPSPKLNPPPPTVQAPATPPANHLPSTNPAPPRQNAAAPKPAPQATPAPPAKQATMPQPRAKPVSTAPPASSHPAAAKPAAKPQSKTPAQPHTPTPRAQASHPAPAKPAAQSSAPKAQVKTPPPAQRQAAPPPHVSHPPAAKPPAQKPAPPKQAPANQKNEAAKGKPTPKP